MKATGVIRRIDDLGRIVIPKEIRKNLRIKSGDNLEIFISEDEKIILRKYNQIDKLKDISKNLSEAIYNITKENIIITNTESVIYVSGNFKKEYQNQSLSNNYIKIMEKRKEIYNKDKIAIEIINDKTETVSYIFSPIIANGDLIGSIIEVSKEQNLTESDEKVIQITATFLSKYIEG